MNYFGIDCGTTNWRFFQCNLSSSSAQPQPVSLTICDPTRHSLLASLLLDADNQVLACGETAYEEMTNAKSDQKLVYGFKPCFGNNQDIVQSDINKRYSHNDASIWTSKLLFKVLERLKAEKLNNCLTKNNQFIFTHPVHWGTMNGNGEITGEILNNFALTIRDNFPDDFQENIQFLSEPEAAILSLLQTKQLEEMPNGYTLIIDIGGGTTDLVAGQFTVEGLKDIRSSGAGYGGNHFDQVIAEYIATQFGLDELQQSLSDRQLQYYGRKFKESLSQQALINYNQPVNLSVMLSFPTKNNVLSQQISLTCDKFEQILIDGKNYLQQFFLESLEKMQLNSEKVSQIILVGGGARLFIIPNILREIFGASVPIMYADPPEFAIARGATLWGMRSSLLSRISVKELVFTPIINDPQPTEIVPTSQVNPTNDLSTMTDNTQIRQEMEQVQAELQSALKEIITLAKKELKPEQLKEIETEFQELNELLERLKTGLVWVALFGKTNAGKSSTANSLIGSEVAGVSIGQNHTTFGTYYEKAPWMLVDVPGTLGTPDLEKSAVEEAKKAHGLIFVVTGEPYEPELALFNLVHNALPNTPKIVFVNQWDKMQDMPKKDRELVCARVREKMGKFVKNPDLDIIYGSASLYDRERDEMVRQELPQLLNKMYEDAGTLGQVMNILDPAHRADDLTQNINNKILEVRIKIARKTINGFATASAAGELIPIPFHQVVTTPGLMAGMVFTIAKIMGKKTDKTDLKIITGELLTACGQVLGLEFTALVALGAGIDVISMIAGPIGMVVSQLVSFGGLSYFHYRRTAILGEVTIEYVRNNYTWAGNNPQEVIKRCKETVSQHYLTLQKKNK